jgi:hypothetical protein
LPVDLYKEILEGGVTDHKEDSQQKLKLFHEIIDGIFINITHSIDL